MILASRNGNLAGDLERRRHVFVVVETADVELIGGAQRNPGPDAVLARFQMIAEIGDGIPGRRNIEPVPAEIAAAIGRDAVPLPDARAVDESQRRKIVRAQLLEARLQAERFVRKIERRAERVVVALGVRHAAHVIDIGQQNLAGEEIRFAILEIGAGERVLAVA